jgi:hypothetical protein
MSEMYDTSHIVNDPKAQDCWIVGWNTPQFAVSNMPGAFAGLLLNSHWRGITYECFDSQEAAEAFCTWWDNKALADTFDGTSTQYCREMHRKKSLFAIALAMMDTR